MAARSRRRLIAPVRWTRPVLYWLAVLVLSVVLTFGFLLWLESHDSSSLDGAAQTPAWPEPSRIALATRRREGSGCPNLTVGWRDVRYLACHQRRS